MIRILHSVSNMDRAGLETMLMNYYRNIDRNKVQFDFLCNKTKPGAYDDEIKAMGGRIYHTPGLNPIKYFRYQRYMKTLFMKYSEYKIIQGHNGAFAVYSLHAAKKANVPIRIYHCHDAGIIYDFKYPLKLICRKFLDKNYTHKWACGEKAARFHYGDKIVDTHQYRCITNAIDVGKFIYNESIRDKIRKRYNLEGKKVIGHIGRFMKEKNHLFLLRMFENLHRQDPNTILILLGDGELMEKMRQKAKELKISKFVLFGGNVDNTNEWYQAFDLFILPSIFEGVPVVGIEAQAAGLPCIFSKEISDEVAVTSHTIFLDLDETLDVWTKTALDMLNNFSMRNNEYDSITKANYNIKVEAKKLQQLYIKLYNSTEYINRNSINE